MISIITPVLNGEKYIERNIISISKLRIDYEHIIVDGGSTDNTLTIVKKYSNVKIVYQIEKSGMYGAIDIGFKSAIYEFITWVNYDDQIIPANFEEAIKWAKKKNLDFVFGNAIVEWTHLKKTENHKSTHFGKYFLENGILPFTQPASFYKREIYEIVQFNFVTYKVSGDLDFFMRIAKHKNIKFRFYNNDLAIFYKDGESFGDKNYKTSLFELKSMGANPSLFFRFLFYIFRGLL